MQYKQDGLVPIGEALADLGGSVAALRDSGAVSSRCSLKSGWSTAFRGSQ